MPSHEVVWIGGYPHLEGVNMPIPRPPIGKPQEVPRPPKPEVEKKHITKDGK